MKTLVYKWRAWAIAHGGRASMKGWEWENGMIRFALVKYLYSFWHLLRAYLVLAVIINIISMESYYLEVREKAYGVSKCERKPEGTWQGLWTLEFCLEFEFKSNAYHWSKSCCRGIHYGQFVLRSACWYHRTGVGVWERHSNSRNPVTKRNRFRKVRR